MPLDDSTISKEPNGDFKEEYCKWCYTDGEFKYASKEQLIGFCVEHMANENLRIGQRNKFGHIWKQWYRN